MDMAGTYTGGEDDAHVRAEDRLIGDIVRTVQDKLGHDAEERLRRLKSVNTFLKHQYTWELKTHVDTAEDGSITPPQETNQPLQRQQSASVRQTEVLRMCVETKQSKQAVVTEQSAEVQADLTELEQEVTKLRQNTSCKQKMKKCLTGKLQDLCVMEQRRNKLTEEKCVLTEQKKALDEESAQLGKEIDLKRLTQPQNCLDLEAEIRSIREEVEVKQKDVTELKDKKESQSEELIRNQKKQLQDELAIWKNRRSVLNDEENNLRSDLLKQDDLTDQCEALENEMKNIQNEIKEKKENLTQMVIKGVQGFHRELKRIHCSETRLIMKVEHMEVEKYGKDYENKWGVYMMNELKDEEKIRDSEAMDKSNNTTLERTVHLKHEIRKARAKEDCNKAIINGAAGLEATQKKLRKEQEKLEKELLKYNLMDETHEQLQENNDSSIAEILRLHKVIGSLETQITSKEAMKRTNQRLALEEKSLNSTVDCLRKRIVWLEEEVEKYLPLQGRISDKREKLKNLKLEIQRIQKENQDATVNLCHQHVEEIVDRALINEVKIGRNVLLRHLKC